MNLLLFGATGRTGSALVDRALARGHAVTAFVRDLSRIDYTRPNLRVLQGDALNPNSVAAALPGHDLAISALGARTLEPTTRLSDATRNVITALEALGPRRLIVTLALGIFRPLEAVEPRFVNISTEHRRILEMLRNSSLNWVAACPPTILDEPGVGQYRAVAGGVPPQPAALSRFDLADFILDQVASDAYLGQAVGVAH